MNFDGTLSRSRNDSDLDDMHSIETLITFAMYYGHLDSSRRAQLHG